MQGQNKVKIPPAGPKVHADDHSCKHLCCRVGLEKPPKASKKRASTTQTAVGPNQLTLSGALAKRTVTKEVQKRKQKETADVKPAEKAPRVRVSGNKSCSMQTGREQWKEPQSKNENTVLISTSVTAKEKDKTSSTVLSGIHSDDDHSDLSSSSWLLRDAGSGFVDPPSVQIPTWREPEVDGIEDSLKNVSPATMSLNRESKPAQSPRTSSSFEFWNDFTSEPEKNVFTNAASDNSSATTVPIATLPENSFKVSRTPERKANSLAEVRGGTGQKQMERYSTREIMSAFHPKLENCDIHPPSGSEEGSPGWEDVDRLLLEEFKDIINFH